MNPINKLLLRLVLLPAGLYTRWNVSIPQLRAILIAKLVMDDRRPNTLQQTRKAAAKTKAITGASLGTMIMSVVMGSLFLLAFNAGDDRVLQLTLYFSFFMVFLCLVLISDFTSVLIDVRDNYIILPKPVGDRTFLMGRLLHIFIYLFRLFVPMSLPGIIFLTVSQSAGAGALLFIVNLLLVVFSICLVNAIYIIILKITTPAKFKNIISYIQIAFAIVIYASYQILPRMMLRIGSSHLTASSKWFLFAPSYWFACLLHMLISWQGSAAEWGGALIGLAIPFLGLFLVIRYLAPSFNQKLSMISGGENAPVAKKGRERAGTKSFSGGMARLLTRQYAERAGFLFSWKMMSRSRDFKLKVYPSIGYVFVIVIVMFMNSSSNVSASERLQRMAAHAPAVIVMSMYFCSMLVMTAINQLIYSDKFRAAWIFFIAPVNKPGELISGAVKAVILKFYLVIALALLVLGTVLGGPSYLPNLLLAMINQLVVFYLVVQIGYRELPFARPVNGQQAGGQLLRTVSLLLISGGVAAAHYFIFRYTLVVIVVTIFSLGALLLLEKKLRKTSWVQLKMRAALED